MESNKTCTKCKAIKNIGEFNKDSHTPDGLCKWCRECRKKRQVEYAADHGLGNFKDNIETLQSAIEYLRKYDIQYAGT